MNKKQPITLGEFRDKTKHLPDHTQFLLDTGDDCIDVFDMALSFEPINNLEYIIIKVPEIV